MMQYDQFIERAESLFLAHGARVLSSDTAQLSAAAWTRDWDLVAVSHEPGSQGVFLFCRPGPGIALTRERLDRTAAALHAGGFSGQAPLSLIVVTAFSAVDDASDRRGWAALTPSVFYQGLRPGAWVVDLASGGVTGGSGRAGTERGLIDAAARADAVSTPDRPEAEAAGVERVRMQERFVALMQERRPMVTLALIAVNVAVFLVLLTRGNTDQGSGLTAAGALVPDLVQQGEWWRLFTAMFLHAGVTHILFNMMSLFFLGTWAERLYGSWKFLLIYLGAGLCGSGASLVRSVMAGQTHVPSVGASGAIFGIAGALITVRFQKSEVIPLRLRQRISASVVPLVVLNLAFALLSPFIDNAAHIGGLIGGIALSFLLPLSKRADVPGGVAAP
jgi:membrane associated rhomboid family serine protease